MSYDAGYVIFCFWLELESSLFIIVKKPYRNDRGFYLSAFTDVFLLRPPDESGF